MNSTITQIPPPLITQALPQQQQSQYSQPLQVQEPFDFDLLTLNKVSSYLKEFLDEEEPEEEPEEENGEQEEVEGDNSTSTFSSRSLGIIGEESSNSNYYNRRHNLVKLIKVKIQEAECQINSCVHEYDTLYGNDKTALEAKLQFLKSFDAPSNSIGTKNTIKHLVMPRVTDSLPHTFAADSTPYQFPAVDLTRDGNGIKFVSTLLEQKLPKSGPESTSFSVSVFTTTRPLYHIEPVLLDALIYEMKVSCLAVNSKPGDKLFISLQTLIDFSEMDTLRFVRMSSLLMDPQAAKFMVLRRLGLGGINPKGFLTPISPESNLAFIYLLSGFPSTFKDGINRFTSNGNRLGQYIGKTICFKPRHKGHLVS